MKAPITTAQAMSHPDVVQTINTLGKMADELRAELEKHDALRAEIEKAQARNETHKAMQLRLFEKLAAQRRVLEQALEALNGSAGREDVWDAITAIQGVLK